MCKNMLIKHLQDALPWSDFLEAMETLGFRRFHSIDPSKLSSDQQYKKLINSGKAIIVNSKVQSLGLKDPSLLSLIPYVIFRPITETQLKEIVIQSQKYKIPITFAAGKTGLSGGFANYAIIVDMTELHSLGVPYKLNLQKEQILVEQGVLVSDLIKVVPIKTNQELIFPIQPASALKLPVRIGGIISSNASGVTSGKLGATEDWLLNVRVMLPDGEIIEIGPNHPLFPKVVGGNGYFAIVLSATFRLYRPEEDLERAIIYGYDLNSAFNGLQSVLEASIYPLISEFVTSPLKLPGVFSDLNKSEKVTQTVKWAAMLKGKATQVNSFINIMQRETNCETQYLTEQIFQEYLQERSTFALLVQTPDGSSDFIAFPGFEDILSPPKYLPEIINTINTIFTKRGFHKVIFGYGHINFRKGKGILLHIRLPVPIEYFYKDNKDKKTLICETVYDIIKTLKQKYNIAPKAEHSPGPFRIWLDSEFRTHLRTEICKNRAFHNPHLVIFENIFKEKQNENPKLLDFTQKSDEDLPEDIKKRIFTSIMASYI
jgi:glycolate oxidase